MQGGCGFPWSKAMALAPKAPGCWFGVASAPGNAAIRAEASVETSGARF